VRPSNCGGLKVRHLVDFDQIDSLRAGNADEHALARGGKLELLEQHRGRAPCVPEPVSTR